MWRSGGRALLVGDFWEKLAGSSIALSAVIALCRAAHFDLVQPAALSSELVPESLNLPHALPLSAYFELAPLVAGLEPQRLLSGRAWAEHVVTTPRARRTAVVLVWSDFPLACRAGIANRSGLARCPQSCVARVRKELQGSYARLTEGWPVTCLSSKTLRRSIRRGGLDVLGRYSAVMLVNWRRHDDSLPLVTSSLALRDRIVVPAASLRQVAHAFLGANGVVPGVQCQGAARRRLYTELREARAISPVTAYSHLHCAGEHQAVQLRSNHVAHELYLSHIGHHAIECRSQLTSCLARLSAHTGDMRPLNSRSTIIASDIATLTALNQDGATHRRHAYMKRCLLPAATDILRWYMHSGIAFGCDYLPNSSSTMDTTFGLLPPGLGGGHCDPGSLGLVDLILASEAATLTAVDVRRPWPSAFLDWIIRLRRRSRKPTTLIRCTSLGNMTEAVSVVSPSTSKSGPRFKAS